MSSPSRFDTFKKGARRAFAYAWIAIFTCLSCLATGTMLSQGDDGVAVVICSGAGSYTVYLDADGNPVEHQQTPCEWSVHSVFIQPYAALIQVNLDEQERAAFMPLLALSKRTFKVAQNHKRGPPILL